LTTSDFSAILSFVDVYKERIMPGKKKLLGVVSGSIKILEEVGRNRHGAVLWLCECACGKQFKRTSNSVGQAEECRTCAHKKDHTGRKFGDLTAIRFVGMQGKTSVWECECVCGTIKNIPLSTLKSIKSCGCRRKGVEPQRNGVGALKNLFVNYKAAAKGRKLQFDLSEEQFENLIKDKCFYCESEPKTLHRTKYGDEMFWNGIDRVDSKLGYCLENCVTACKSCNLAKNVS
jgi:hypothetical protein